LGELLRAGKRHGDGLEARIAHELGCDCDRMRASSPAIGIAIGSPARCDSLMKKATLIELKARTTWAPGK